MNSFKSLRRASAYLAALLLGLLMLTACGDKPAAPAGTSTSQNSPGVTEAGEVIVVDVFEDSPALREIQKARNVTDEVEAQELFAQLGRGGEAASAEYAKLRKDMPTEIWVQYLGSGCFAPDSVTVELAEDGTPTFKPLFKKRPEVNCFRAVPSIGFVGLS